MSKRVVESAAGMQVYCGVEVGVVVESRAREVDFSRGEMGAEVADRVLSAYRDAVCGVLAVVRFGALLMAVEGCLTRETTSISRHDPSGEGPSLKSWLKENCPDVNYKTAMRMKGTGSCVCEVLGLDAGVVYRALDPDPKALGWYEDFQELVEVRELLVGIVEGRSVRSLVMWLKGGAPKQVEVEPGKEEDVGRAPLRALESAGEFAKWTAQALKCLDNKQKLIVAQDVARVLRHELGLVGIAWLARVLAEAEASQ